MLQRLHIRDFAIIEHIELEFQPGFTTISGETGAGKSIMVDALAFLLGARAERGWVRQGGRGAEIVGDFSLRQNPAARDWLAENALEEDDQCLLRRSLLAAGGSRAWINGRPVTLGQLQSLAELLITIHGQHEHQHLLAAGQRRTLLDQWGALEDQTRAVATAFGEWQACHSRLRKLESAPDIDPQHLQLLHYQLDELKREALSAEDYQAMFGEHERLAHTEELQLGLGTALNAIDDDSRGAAGALQTALNSIRDIAGKGLDLADVEKMLDEASINLAECQQSLQQLLDDCESNPDQLRELERRLGRQHDLARKHQVEPDALEQQIDAIERQIRELSQSDQLREQLRAELADRLRIYQQAARQLSEARKDVANRISAAASDSLAHLGFKGARVEIRVDHDSETEPREHGLDKIDILVRTNPGQPAAPLQKIASGGELSRISLALQLAVRQLRGNGNRGMTQVYDEIDSGIGGETAQRVGELLRQLSGDGQVLCVTHLAQVAARADQQFQVLKTSDTNSTRVQVIRLDKRQRVEEIARMLSGKLSASSRKHASELLQG